MIFIPLPREFSMFSLWMKKSRRNTVADLALKKKIVDTGKNAANNPKIFWVNMWWKQTFIFRYFQNFGAFLYCKRSLIDECSKIYRYSNICNGIFLFARVDSWIHLWIACTTNYKDLRAHISIRLKSWSPHTHNRTMGMMKKKIEGITVVHRCSICWGYEVSVQKRSSGENGCEHNTKKQKRKKKKWFANAKKQLKAHTRPYMKQ